MIFKKIIDEINIVKQCRKYDMPVWQCPQFLFLIMGIIIILSIILTYIISERYIEDSLLITLMILFITIVLFVIATIITRSFERLAEANRIKSEFVSIVSHQLRSPLSNLKWVIEFLMSGKVCSISEKQAEYFKILKENNDRMTNLIADLLIVSKIDQNQIFLNKEKVSLVELIQEIIRKKDSFIKALNVEIDFSFEKDLPLIITDSFQVKIIIENLLDNAVRYTEKQGKVLINLKKKKNNFLVEVKDDGIGIPQRDQKYVFQKFFRSDNIKRHQTEGSGLGLYIAKSITQKLGGKMNFKSQEGMGSTFWFNLPIIKK
jgi:signal transduction histidine kinase